MTQNDDSHRVIFTSFEDEYDETNDPAWVWHAIDFFSTWQRKTGSVIPSPNGFRLSIRHGRNDSET